MFRYFYPRYSDTPQDALMRALMEMRDSVEGVTAEITKLEIEVRNTRRQQTALLELLDAHKSKVD